MNTERLLREVEKRLVGLTETHRAEVLDALREEIGRERRRVDPSATVEAERERRLEAETLREILEAINRQANLEETVSEVLKQLARLVVYDSCSLSLLEPDGQFRVVGVRGFHEPSRVLGMAFRNAITDLLVETRREVLVQDIQEDELSERSELTSRVHSWAGIPLLVEGLVLGLVSLDRHRVEPFDDEELHGAKAVAFSAAAAIRKSQLHEHVRRYAALMERVVAVDQAVFTGDSPSDVAQTILEGALRVGGHTAGLLILESETGPRVAAASGDLFAQAPGRSVPRELAHGLFARLDERELRSAEVALGFSLTAGSLLRVPLTTPERSLGALALLAVDATSSNRLMESYASRVATAYAHATRRR